MLDDVLRWLVGVTGLEPKLLTLTAILIVYASSVYRYAKEKAGAGVAPAQPVEFGELTSALARVERGVETVAKYLINLEPQPRFQPRHEYEAFLPPNGAGAPPLNHHRPEAPPPKRVRHVLSQPEEERGEAFFRLPLPVMLPREATEITENEIQHEPEPQSEPEDPPKIQPSPAVRETLKRMSRKAGRSP